MPRYTLILLALLVGGFFLLAQSSPVRATALAALTPTAEPPTPIPPTDTPIPPTNTPVPPTDTPIPPTNTPVPSTGPSDPGPTSTPVVAAVTATATATATPLLPETLPETGAPAPRSGWPVWLAAVALFGLGIALVRRRTFRG